MSARRRIVLLAAVALLVTLAVWRWLASAPSTDAQVHLSAAPQRIVSLTLATDEILLELVATERVVAVTYLTDDPEISNVPNRYPIRIPRFRDIAPERIIGLSPDLVCVAPYNSADFLKVIERSGLSIYRNENVETIDQIEAGIAELGRRVGEPGRAQALLERMRGRRRQLADQLARISRRPRVLFWSAGFTAGRHSTIDDIIREAGGINAVAEKNLKGSAEVSPEQVIATDPDFILLGRWSADDREGRIENHPLLRNLRAVREKRVIVVDGRYLTAVSHHVIEGAERLAQKLHPGLSLSSAGAQ